MSDEPTVHSCGCVTRYVADEPRYVTTCQPHQLFEMDVSLIKVNYWEPGAAGYTSTAYLHESAAPDGMHYGADKHTDNPVRVRWNDDTERWETA